MQRGCLVGICADATSGAAAGLQDDFFELVEFPVGQPGKIGRHSHRVALVTLPNPLLLQYGTRVIVDQQPPMTRTTADQACGCTRAS